MLKKNMNSRADDTIVCSNNKQYYINPHPTTDGNVTAVLWLLIFYSVDETRRKRTIILSLQVLKPVTILYYWPANISLSQNWMSTFPSSAMLATMIRFTLCNCENCTDPFWKPLFVWCRGTRIRGSSKGREKGNCGTKRWLNCCKQVISWIYSILKSIHQTLLRALVPETCSLPVWRFKHEDTFRKVTVIAIRRTEYDAVQIGTYIPIHTTSYPNNTGNLRIM